MRDEQEMSHKTEEMWSGVSLDTQHHWTVSPVDLEVQDHTPTLKTVQEIQKSFPFSIHFSWGGVIWYSQIWSSHKIPKISIEVPVLEKEEGIWCSQIWGPHKMRQFSSRKGWDNFKKANVRVGKPGRMQVDSLKVCVCVCGWASRSWIWSPHKIPKISLGGGGGIFDVAKTWSPQMWTSKITYVLGRGRIR